MIHFASALIVGISLTLYPAIAKDFRDNKPSAEKQQYCEWTDYGQVTVYIDHHQFGGVVVCDSFGDSGTKC